MMAVPATPLVLTKLHTPTLRSRIIPRKRLVEQLTPQTDAGLILVCAPAGYGKTTLLSQWSQILLENGVAVAWYALDPSDDELIPFSSYLVAGLTQALGPKSELIQIAELLRTSPEVDLYRIMSTLINVVEASQQDCLLILDDYHLISTPSIHSAIAFLIEHLPENMHVVISSRSDPPLPLARLRAHGQVLEIRVADLRLTLDEATLFLNEVMQLGLLPEVVTELEMRTEGWIAGLQLVALSLAGQSDNTSFISSLTGNNRYLVEYLLEEVLSRLPEMVQSFLLPTSILDRMCGSLCDAILDDTSGSEEMLDQLNHANLFVIALDHEGYWYRYHHLFRDFLQTRLCKTQPEQIPLLHHTASEWFASQGLLREAVQHALQTHDWTYVANQVEKYGMPTLMHSDISTVYGWCAAFPQEIIQAHPMLSILFGWTLVLGYRGQNRDRIEEHLQLAEQAAAALEDKQQGRWLAGQAAVVRTFLGMIPNPTPNPHQQLAIAQRALDLLPPGDPLRSTTTLTIAYAPMAAYNAQAGYEAMEKAKRLSLEAGNFYGAVDAIFHQARLAYNLGQLRRSVEICQQGYLDISSVVAHPELELPAVGCLDLASGCVLLEQDKLAEAEKALLRGLNLIGWTINPYYQMTACVALFRLCEIQGRFFEALGFLDRLQETWPDISFLTHALRVMHCLRTAPEDQGTMVKATSWSQAYSSSFGDDLPLSGIGPLGAAEAYYLASFVWAFVQIAIGTPQAARSYITQQLDLAEAHGLMTRVIELSLLKALAANAEGHPDRTQAALEHALAAGQPEGYIRIFDQGTDLPQLLDEAAHRGKFREYVGQILDHLNAPKTYEVERREDAALHNSIPVSAQPPYLEAGQVLSDRELDVLRLMAQGASNQEIAGQLVITVGTVKSHITHILGKLDADNRTKAVARARELGLLEI